MALLPIAASNWPAIFSSHEQRNIHRRQMEHSFCVGVSVTSALHQREQEARKTVESALAHQFPRFICHAELVRDFDRPATVPCRRAPPNDVDFSVSIDDRTKLNPEVAVKSDRRES